MSIRSRNQLFTAGFAAAVTLAFSSWNSFSQTTGHNALGKRTAHQDNNAARRSTVVGAGEVLANRLLQITRDLPGRIHKIYVEAGDEVIKGQALIDIETAPRDAKLITQYSPLTGIVADIPARVGDITPGRSSNMPLMTIADMSKIYIEVNVDGEYMPNLAVAQTAKIVIDAFYKARVRGLVVRKDPHPIAPSGPPEFRVTIEITQIRPDIRRRLRPGMTAVAWIAT